MGNVVLSISKIIFQAEKYEKDYKHVPKGFEMMFNAQNWESLLNGMY